MNHNLESQIGFRVAVAGLMYESNSFSPGTATAEVFRSSGWYEGKDVLTQGRGLDCIAGVAAVAAREGIEIVPITSAGLLCGPLLAVGEYAKLKQRLLDGLQSHIGQVDAVYLSLHGAMVCADEDDSEGDLIEAVSELMDVPVAVSLDLHCYFTDRMAQGTALISGYHTLPHLDQVETGERAMSLLVHRLRGGNPTIAWTRIPMLTSAEGQDTNVEPVRTLIQRVEQMVQEAGVLDGALYMTQPWLDVPTTGWTAVVVTDDDPELARRYSEELAQMAWDVREQVLAPKVSVKDAVDYVCSRAHQPELGPFVLSDGADSVSAGAAGDGPELIAALAAKRLPGPGLAIITDAPAASVCHEAGVGATVRLQVGASRTTRLFTPIPIEGVVRSLHDDAFESIYPPSETHPGKTAVVVLENGLHLIVVETAVAQLDLEPFRHVGLEPGEAHVVVAKSAGGYRAYYGAIARQCIDVATHGPADSRIEHLPFERLTRPIYPFDKGFEWTPEANVSASR